MSVTEAVIPPVREVRVRLRRVRRTHSDRSLGDLLTDVYLVAFIVVLYGGSTAYSVRRHLSKAFTGPVGLESTRAWIVVALVVVVVSLAWRGLRALGPLVTTPAALSWCLSTPIDRAVWLRTPLVWLFVVCGLVGALVGPIASWAGIAGASTPLGLTSLFAAVTGAAVGLILAAAAVRAQSRPSPRVGSRIRPADVVLVVSVALVALAVATRAGHIHTGPPTVPAWILAVVAVAAAAALVRAALRALPQVDRAALTGSAQLGTAAVTSVVMLDPTLLSGIIEARRWRRPGKVHSRRFLGSGRDLVLVQADILRQLRRPGNLFVWAALLLAPFAAAVFAPAAASPIRVVAAYLAAERLSSGLRLISRTPALRRTLGGTDWELKRIHLVVPGVGLALWWGITSYAVPTATSPLLSFVLVAGLLGAVYRTATRPPMSYDAGLSDTPMGPVPTLLLRRLLRGPDLVAVLVLIDLFL